jgi:hypothetical protein
MAFDLVGREAKQRFRCGHVAPPSINPNGKVYRWFHSGLDGKDGFGGPPLLLMASTARNRRSISERAWQRLWCSQMHSRQMQG